MRTKAELQNDLDAIKQFFDQEPDFTVTGGFVDEMIELEKQLEAKLKGEQSK